MDNCCHSTSTSFYPAKFPSLERIVSGGQTGADRAALDVAIRYHLPHGGWCPMGRRAEDGPIDHGYRLRETASSDYLPRTERNVVDSDATVIFTMKPAIKGGSRRTLEFAERHGKPCLHLHPGLRDDPVKAIVGFVESHHLRVLNVAGSRESKEPDLYRWTYWVLEEAFFASDEQRAMAAARYYLGPAIEVTSIQDNATAPLDYGNHRVPDCWRVYYQIAGGSPSMVGGDSSYLLVAKKTHRILQQNTESGE